MEKQIEAIDGLIEEIGKVESSKRTAHLDIASGRLDAAKKHLLAHGEELARLKEAKLKALKEKEEEVARLKAETAAAPNPVAPALTKTAR